MRTSEQKKMHSTKQWIYHVFLDLMVANLGVRTHKLQYYRIFGNIIAKILSALVKEICYEEVANHSQRISTIQ